MESLDRRALEQEPEPVLDQPFLMDEELGNEVVEPGYTIEDNGDFLPVDGPLGKNQKMFFLF